MFEKVLKELSSATEYNMLTSPEQNTSDILFRAGKSNEIYFLTPYRYSLGGQWRHHKAVMTCCRVERGKAILTWRIEMVPATSSGPSTAAGALGKHLVQAGWGIPRARKEVMQALSQNEPLAIYNHDPKGETFSRGFIKADGSLVMDNNRELAETFPITRFEREYLAGGR